MKLAILFDNFGPYHVARLAAAGGIADLLAIQVNTSSREYSWTPIKAVHRNFSAITLLQPAPYPVLGMVNANHQVWRALQSFHPDCVFLPGWSRLYAMTALAWCRNSK